MPARPRPRASTRPCGFCRTPRARRSSSRSGSQTESIAQVMETQARLRGESTTLFERMREANVLLHEVLTGAHENMATIESSLTSRVIGIRERDERRDRAQRRGRRADQRACRTHSATTPPTCWKTCPAARAQFEQHGRTLVAGRRLRCENSNQRAEETVGERRATLETLVATLDAKSEDLDQRLQRFTASARSVAERCRSARARDRPHDRGESRPPAPARSPSSSNWCARPPNRSASAPAT